LIFSVPLMKLLAPGFSGETYELTLKFTRILLFSPIFLAGSAITGSVLNSLKKFALVSAVPVVYNLSIIGGVLLLYPKLGPIGLAWGVVGGTLLYFLLPLPQLFRSGFRYFLSLDYRQAGFMKFWQLYWPRIFTMGTGQISLIIATFFGSYLSEGSLSAFYYANNLQSVFLSVFAISASIAVFPTLSDLYNQKDEQRFRDVLAKTTVQVLYFLVPLSVAMLVLRAQIVRLLLGIGEGTNFSFQDTKIVSLTLGIFVVSLFAQGLVPLFTRAFYARHNTKIPVVTSLISLVVNIILAYYLVSQYGIAGMAMSFSFTVILQLLMLLVELHRKIGSLHDEYLILSSIKIAISSVIAGLAIYVSLYLVAPLVDMQTYVGVFVQALGSGFIGGLCFLGASLALGLEESRHLTTMVKSFMVKISRPLLMIINIWE